MNGHLFVFLAGLHNGLIFIAITSVILLILFFLIATSDPDLDWDSWRKKLKILLAVFVITTFAAFLIPDKETLAKAANFNCGVLLKGF